MAVRYPVNVLKGSLLDLSIIWPVIPPMNGKLSRYTALETGKTVSR